VVDLPNTGPQRRIAVVDLLVAFGKPWTYWLAPVVTLVAILGVLSFFIRYLVKVTAARYPKQ